MAKTASTEGSETLSSTGGIPVTVVIPVKNEELNLERCLKALSRFADVVVVDSGSTDRTQEIAIRAGAKVIDFRWDGRYPKKRNWVLINHALPNEWVLFLDADEFVDHRFCDEMAAAVASGRHAGYWLNYTNYFLGRRLGYGVPQKKLALFRVSSGLYERIQEDSWSKLDMEVHEHPTIRGSVGEIRAPIEHNDFRGIDKFLDRHRDYARWEARRFLLLERQSDLDGRSLTTRQRFKYRSLERWWYPWFYFLYAYIVRLGFFDGAAGFQYAFYKAWYFLTIRLMIRELRKCG
ncbi:glycosyltransferase family 2 protein [Mesorhizobium sp.]|uniref:glycosyltransferase family 2 protein n=1 Tax=Mesorhizobium sp. TaxID=1871066 RepID=UPI00257C4DAB|nr:glycosyltransferase family 2 protein [Mesorhizobium sp.]